MTDHLADALTIIDWGSRQVEHSADLSPAQCMALREYIADLESRVPKVEGEVAS